MKSIYKKLLSLIIFLSLMVGQSAYCAVGEGDGFDIKELKKIKNVKNIFHKKSKTVPKSLKLEETTLDNSPFSSFEDGEAETGVDGFPVNNVKQEIKEPAVKESEIKKQLVKYIKRKSLIFLILKENPKNKRSLKFKRKQFRKKKSQRMKKLI